MGQKCKPCFAFFLAIIATIVSFSFSIPAFAEEDNGYLIVYVTDSGGRYHSEGCGSLYNSKNRITLEDAIRNGYTRCDRCNPPVYTGSVTPGEAKEVRSGGSSSQSYSKSSRSNDDKPESMTDLQQNAQHRTTIAEREKAAENQRTIENGKRNSVDVGNIVLYLFLGIIVFLIFVVPLLFKLYESLPWVKRKKEREEQEARRIAEEEKRKREQEEREEKQKELQEKYEKGKYEFYAQLEDLFLKVYVAPKSAEEHVLEKRKELLRLCIKNDVCIKNGFVCDRTGKYFGERFTVYVSNTGRYHLGKCRYGGYKPAHLLHASKYGVPCSVCNPNITIEPWMQDCERLHKEIEEINFYLSVFNEETEQRILAMKRKMDDLFRDDSDGIPGTFCGTPMLRHQGKD